MRLVLGGHKTSGSLPLPARILVYVEGSTGFGHIYRPDGLSNTLRSQGCFLATVFSAGRVGRT